MTYDQIYQNMKTQYQTETTQTVRDDGDLGLRMQVVAGEVAAVYQQLDYLKKQIFPQTATEEYLTHHATCRGIEPKVATAATGTLRFDTDTPVTQRLVIPKGTTCTASQGNGVTYQTTVDSVIEVGGTTAFAHAVATEVGGHTNVEAAGIDIIVGGIVGVSTVTNQEGFTGGSDAEHPEVLRKRLLESFVRISTGANKQFYKELAQAVPGVHSAQVVEADGGVIIYIADIFRTTSTQLVEAVQQQVDRQKSVGTAVTVKKATVINQAINATVYVDNALADQVQQLTARNYLQDQALLLGIGERLNPYTLANRLDEQILGMTEIVFSQPINAINLQPGQIVFPVQVQVAVVANNG